MLWSYSSASEYTEVKSDK